MMIKNKVDYVREKDRYKNLKGLIKDYKKLVEGRPEGEIFKKQLKDYKRQFKSCREYIKDYEKRRGIESKIR